MIKVVFKVNIPKDGVTSFEKNFRNYWDFSTFLTEIRNNIQCEIRVGVERTLIILKGEEK